VAERLVDITTELGNEAYVTGCVKMSTHRQLENANTK
jgi:hypothetical protein